MQKRKLLAADFLDEIDEALEERNLRKEITEKCAEKINSIDNELSQQMYVILNFLKYYQVPMALKQLHIVISFRLHIFLFY